MNLLDFLHRCVDVGIKLNLEKLEFRKQEITFIGHIASKDGLNSEPEKVRTFYDIIEPSNRTEIYYYRELLMEVYTSTVGDTRMPDIPLVQGCVLDMVLCPAGCPWESQRLDRICSYTCILQTREGIAPLCECGLEAALFRGGRSLAFVSRTLSNSERRYVQIEEMLAVSYGLTRFHHYRKVSNIRRTLVGNKINYIFILDLTSGFKGFNKDSRKTVRESFKCWDLVRLILETWRYTYGRGVRVISDHKPLVSIGKKSLEKAFKPTAPTTVLLMLPGVQDWQGYTSCWCTVTCTPSRQAGHRKQNIPCILYATDPWQDEASQGCNDCCCRICEAQEYYILDGRRQSRKCQEP